MVGSVPENEWWLAEPLLMAFARGGGGDAGVTDAGKVG
jgi:hypothetical protein